MAKRANYNAQMDKTVQMRGKGRTNRIVAKDYSISSTGTEQIQLYSFVSSSQEFTTCAIQYRYFRLTKIQITIFPSAVSNSASAKPYYVLMAWTDDSISSQNIEQDDSTVIIPSIMFKPMTRTFLPLNINMPTGGGLTILNAINPRQWIVADDIKYSTTETTTYYFPGTLLVKHPSVGNYRVSLFFQFQGSKIPTASLYYELYKVFSLKEKQTQHVEGKKEEDKKEEEEKEDDVDEEEIKSWSYQEQKKEDDNVGKTIKNEEKAE